MPSKVGIVVDDETKPSTNDQNKTLYPSLPLSPTPSKTDRRTDPNTNDLAKRNGKTKIVKVKEKNAETEAIESCCPCIKTIRHKFWLKCIVFSAVFLLNAADLICDWLLFKDVYSTEEGLVYGPPQTEITWSILAFAILGSFTFIFEIVNLWWEVFRDNPWIDSDLASSITIWIEDVPQIALNLAIVVCREEAISYLQLVKASIMIFGICIWLIVSCVKYCSKENLAKTKEKTTWAKQHIAYRVFIMFGLILIFAASVSIFFLTQFERDINGKIKFNIPQTLFEGKFDDERYFDNVSMYFNHEIIDFDNDPNNANWVRLITLYDVREKKDEWFKIEYDTTTKTKIVIWQTGNHGSFDAKECYTIDKTAKTLTKGSSCLTFITGTKEFFIFKFHFIKRKIPELIFGDIEFNVKLNDASNNCKDPSTSVVNSLSRRQEGNIRHPVIHYYRTQPTVTQTHHTILSTGTSARFFKNSDLIDITTVWKTGFGSCESSGSLSPHLKSSITVNCTL